MNVPDLSGNNRKQLRLMSDAVPSYSRNKYVYGRGCDKFYELVRKKKSKKVRSYPHPVTLIEAERNIKESAMLKESHDDLHLEIVDKLLKIKCHHE